MCSVSTEANPSIELIQSALSETVESMAFEEAVFSDWRPSLPGSFSEPMCWTTIVILDPPIGQFGLYLPGPLATQFSEAIFSRPGEEMTPQLVLDNLGELMNTLAGRLLANRLPPETAFRLDFPNFGSDLVMSPDVAPDRVAVFLISGREVFLTVPEAYWTL